MQGRGDSAKTPRVVLCIAFPVKVNQAILPETLAKTFGHSGATTPRRITVSFVLRGRLRSVERMCLLAALCLATSRASRDRR